MKTSELIGPALDWAVATCEKNWAFEPDGCDSYSTDWALGGPIIEREEIGIKRRMPCMYGEQWEAFGSQGAKGAGYNHAYGPSPLIAAMRCFVSFRLGDHIEIPSELIKGI